MSADLDQFESLLRAHFQRLAEAKRPSGQPLFALEHCLDAPSLNQMRGHLYASIPHHGMSVRFKYCWLVHAAEHGYTFEGLEFWQSFARLTPRWTYYGDREVLRGWFAEFAHRFNGARPEGRWGQHFRYIAWPITHALLPSDLQVQLAHALYRLRYNLDELILLDYESAGRMVARQAEWPSARFKHFLEQHVLVGRVVWALLERTPDEPIIYQATLERITNDLNAKGQARAWLHDARKYFDRFKIKLAASNPSYSLMPRAQPIEESPSSTDTDMQAVLLRPRLQLRRVASNRWEVQLLVPSFHALANLKPTFREHLARARYRIPSHGNQQFLGQSLLSGRPIPRRLVNWPEERSPLLKFNEADVIFDRIVDAECQLIPAKVWVFFCLDDGSARHVQGQHVRAGQSYVVVSKDAELIEGLGDAVDLDCEGVSAIRLEIPAIVDVELQAALKRAEIALHGNVLVEPVGLRPRQWNDGGVGEWLSTEIPLLSLTCEFDTHTYLIELNGTKRFEILRVPGNEPTLISFRDLATGRHHVSISALCTQNTPFGVLQKCLATAAIEIYIRHPTIWSPHAQLPEAIVVDVTPSIPSLDDFLEHRLLLRAEGDEARTVSCNLVLTNPTTHDDLVSPILKHRLPVLPDVWSKSLGTFLSQCDEMQLLNASSAAIVLHAEDLGEVRIPLHIEMEPLRWALAKNRAGTKLFLADEGVTDDVSVTFYEFDHPFHGKDIDVQTAEQGIECTSNPGLYVARAGTLSVAIAIATEERARSLAALGVQVSRGEFSNEIPIEQLMSQLKLWTAARASSLMAKLKRRSICATLESRVLAHFCGAGWMRLEKDFDHDSNDDNWGRLEAGVDSHISFAISLVAEWRKTYSDATFEPSKCLERVALQYRITGDPRLVAVAWLLAANPAQADDAMISEALSARMLGALIRGARLLVLCRARQWGTN